jgi:tRNA (mo5U34)-methyltransferase
LSDDERLAADLQAAGLADWYAPLVAITRERLSPAGHGDFPRWQAAVDALPGLRAMPGELQQALLALSPWRKGPFDVGTVHIDAEWRSDLKWARLRDAVEPLAGRRILDVGCGNGWYALQMRAAGAQLVIGIDPTVLYVMQFRAVTALKPMDGVHVLPLRLAELPDGSHAFDTVFSMGVLYHQRSPIDHLSALRECLRPGGQLVLETLVLPGDDARAVTPPGRYARMKNVWLLPTVAELDTWLARTGFRGTRLVDVTVTTVAEQRPTPWMTFESLAEALDPERPGLTVEGWPAPRRAVLTATAPA